MRGSTIVSLLCLAFLIVPGSARDEYVDNDWGDGMDKREEDFDKRGGNDDQRSAGHPETRAIDASVDRIPTKEECTKVLMQGIDNGGWPTKDDCKDVFLKALLYDTITDQQSNKPQSSVSGNKDDIVERDIVKRARRGGRRRSRRWRDDIDTVGTAVQTADTVRGWLG